MISAVRFFKQLVERFLNQRFGLGIHRAGRFVENENLRIESQRPRERQELALALGQGRAALLDFFLITLRQLFDKRRDLRARAPLRRMRCFADARVAESNVGRDVAGKQKHILQHQTQVAAQLLLVPLADVDAVDQDRAALDIVEAAERGDDRGLAAAGGADQSDFFTGADAKGNVFEHRLAGLVGKPDVFEFDLAGEFFDALGLGPDS